MKKYNVIVIGAGICGLMVAHRLIQSNRKISILVIEKGKEIVDRKCPVLLNKTDTCADCRICSIMSGCAGAGAFSDGKFIISTDYGGNLQNYMEKNTCIQYMRDADEILIKHGATKDVYEPNEDITNLCKTNDLLLKKGYIKHFGTENNIMIMQNFVNDLRKKCTILCDCVVEDVKPDEHIVITNKGNFLAEKIIFAVGRSGNSFLADWCRQYGVKTYNTNVDIGVRVELKDDVWKHISSIVYDPKISFISKQYKDETRMFCFNVGGQVVVENTYGTKTVNGHAYSSKNLKSDNCNFALLSSIKMSQPFNDPTEYIRHLASCANIISGNNVVVQRFGDLIKGKRTTEIKLKQSSVKPTLNAYPGDLSLCLPKRQLDNIIETLYQLDKIAPGTAGNDTLLYGIEGKYYSSIPDMIDFRIKGYENIYACGDGSGVTRSLAQAAANGLYVADKIIKEYTKTPCIE